jgi:hypothetical protein
MTSSGLVFLWALMPSSVRPYFDQFKDDYAARLPNRNQITKVIIYLESKMPNNILGQCVMYLGIIRIDKKYWEQAGDYERSDLLYHELGHCVLGLEHANNPEDIMYPAVSPIKSKWYPRVDRFFKEAEHE